MADSNAHHTAGVAIVTSYDSETPAAQLQCHWAMTDKTNMPFRVFLVEDEPLVRDHLTEALGKLPNLEVEVAETQVSAKRLLEDAAKSFRPYDCVILDLALPRSCGDEPELNHTVYRELRKHMENAVAIHTTAYPRNPEVMEFVLNETMRSPDGPRSVFLPRTDSNWTDEIVAMVKRMQTSPSRLSPPTPRRFLSCFISYSHKDEDFAEKLHKALSANGVDVWYAPIKMKPGVKIHEEIDHNVRLYDKFLLVLSDDSMGSEWVKTEIRTALDEERTSKGRKLIPVRLVPFDTLRAWKCFNSDTGKDMAVELREYFIPDFTHWKVETKFEHSMMGLFNALRKLDA